MTKDITITGIDIIRFQYETKDMGRDNYYNSFNMVYTPGDIWKRTGHILQIHTSAGVTGEFAQGNEAEYAQMRMYMRYLMGKNPLKRELFYNDVKRALRKFDRKSMGLVDISLWDIAGKLYDAPVYELLGGYRESLPAYASTYHGDENGGLDTPEAFADFAEQCYDMGFRGFKIHGWSHAPIQREVDNVLEVGKRVGHKMDLMLDPACEYETFADAFRVGRACDEAGFFWYEDPFKDAGISCFAQRNCAN